ncbi:MAG TPA: quinol:electron acceptor oxidoreductase subunit ActD [Blastocatellia bacterium]|jgi:hypothetical protein
MAARIIAIFDTPLDALAASGKLREAGVPRSAITLMSSEPLHDEPFESEHKKSHIGALAIVGGFIGAACAVLLTVLTSRRVDLVTGGMPIVTPWAFGIVVFELTALGAILATLGMMIYEARLARRGASDEYDKAVSEGNVVLCVRCEDPSLQETAQAALGSNVRGSD